MYKFVYIFPNLQLGTSLTYFYKCLLKNWEPGLAHVLTPGRWKRGPELAYLPGISLSNTNNNTPSLRSRARFNKSILSADTSLGRFIFHC